MRNLILGIALIVCLDAFFIALTYLATDVDFSIKAIATDTGNNLELSWLDDLRMESYISPITEVRKPLRVVRQVSIGSAVKETMKRSGFTSYAVSFPTRIIYIPSQPGIGRPEPSRIRIVKNGNTTLILYPGADRLSEQRQNIPSPRKTVYVASLERQLQNDSDSSE